MLLSYSYCCTDVYTVTNSRKANGLVQLPVLTCNSFMRVFIAILKLTDERKIWAYYYFCNLPAVNHDGIKSSRTSRWGWGSVARV